MKFKTHKLAGLLAAVGMASILGISARTADAAFTFRMGAGSPGDVNRTHPASIVPGLVDATTPVRLYGDAVLVNTAANSYKGFGAGDTAITVLQGVCVRPYPIQQSTGGMSSALGTAAAPTSGFIDVIRQGFVMVKIPPGVTVTKNGAVFVWCAATAGNNVQGGFVGAATGGSTAAVTNARFTGPADATGVVEIEIWPA